MENNATNEAAANLAHQLKEQKIKNQHKDKWVKAKTKPYPAIKKIAKPK